MSERKYKITYILGAGASAKALPTVRKTEVSSGYTNALRQMAVKMNDDAHAHVHANYRLNFAQDLIWLAEMGDKHGTPDTFAKFCILKNDHDSLTRIKATLALYFTIEQFLEKKTDPRYLQFITKVLENSLVFPDNIKILNWNYDFQFQLAAETFKQERFLYGKMVTQHVTPLLEYYPSLGHEFNVNQKTLKENYGLVHLNGIAGFYFYSQTGHILNYFLNDGLKSLSDLFEKHHADIKYKQSLLSFAFETNPNYNYAIRNRLSAANKIIEQTDYLVIIGYSFPLDNVETDTAILNTLKNGGLKGIYFQDPINDGHFLRDTFNISNDIPIQHIKSTDEFYVPRQFKMTRI